MENRLFAILILSWFTVSPAWADYAPSPSLAPIGSQGWEGPAQSPGAGLGGLAKPTNFIDASGIGTWGDNPYTDSRFRANYVLSQDATDTTQINLHANRFHLNEDITLISSPDGFSTRDLWSVGVGATYSHKMDKGEWGLIGGVGSNSDKPFNSFHETSLQLTGTWRLPVDDLHSWIFFLSYANDRAFAPSIPIPGASYLVIDPADHLIVSYGLPFFFSWKPNGEWAFRLVYFIPTLINAEISYALSTRLKAHIGFDWYPQAWLPANRSDTKDEFIFDQKKASLGLRASIASDWFLDVTGGYAFDQKIFEAENLFANGINKNYLSAGPFLQTELALKF